MSKYQSPKPLKSAYPEAIAIAGTITLLLLVGIPVTQMLSDTFNPIEYRPHDPTVINPPKMELPEPVIEQPDPDKPVDKLEDKPVYPTINDLEVNLDPNLDGFYPTSVAGIVPVIDDASLIHSIGNLTRAPRAIQQPKPVYPGEMKRARISGSVLLEFVVDANGTTRLIEVVDSTNPAFDAAARRAVRKWIFEPGEKDGRAVHSRVRMQMPFRYN